MVTMKDCGSYAAMIFVQLAYGGSSILSKMALQKGLSSLVFIVYRHIIAMLVLGLFAYFIERKQRPPLSVPILVKIFFLASLGITIHQNLFYVGLDYSSPTVAGALSNVIPGLTFMLAVLLRMEKVQMRSVRGRVKLFGTITCIGGALIFTLWKGYLFKGFVRSPLIIVHGKDSDGRPQHIKDDWIKGSALILISNVAFSGWLILQANVYEAYPARLSINTMMCFFASLQCSVAAIAFDRKIASWRLDWNVQLLTIIYCGTVISTLVYYLQTWCISEKGPVFNAMFSPLFLVVVGIFSAFVFAERLHLGSVIGAFLIIFGLYCVLWSKSKDVNVSQMEGKQEKERSTTNQISMENLSNQISANDQHVIVPIRQEKSDIG